MSYFKNRLREPSTWAGLASVLATAVQAYATRDPQAIGATVAGLVAIATPEKKAA
jgi:hypothetical protein